MNSRIAVVVLLLLMVVSQRCLAAYDLEVPADPWEEYRQQFQRYSQQLQKSYDCAFLNDYEGALVQASKAIDILPEEGLAYAERAKYHRMLGHNKDAELDLRKALTLFDKAIQRYRRVDVKHAPGVRKPGAAELAKLIATLRYQRGEAYLVLEQYRQAKEDLGAACEGGSAVACARFEDAAQAEIRGANWVPLASRQFYDRDRLERPFANVVNVWVRQEDGQLVAGNDKNISVQRVELECATREYRIKEAETAGGKSAETPLQKPSAGSTITKLMYLVCPPGTLN